MDSKNSVWYILLGAVVALITSLLVEVYKYWISNRTSRKDFQIFLKLELKNVTASIDRLINAYGNKQFFDFTILSELYNKIQRLEKLRDGIINIKNDQKKEEVLSLFNLISLFQSDAYNIESSAFRAPNPNIPEQGLPLPWNSDIYKSQRQMAALQSVDIKRKVQDLITFFEK